MGEQRQKGREYEMEGMEEKNERGLSRNGLSMNNQVSLSILRII